MKKTTYDRCDLCGGILSAGKTSLEIRRNGDIIILNDIPADLCEQCGESYISAEISEKLDHFLEEYRQHRPDRYIPVPEFSAVQAMGIEVSREM
ncbi:type II toxin-antitoxin system MqsA family antitoxin [Desulfococcaceae bacterium HSG8]|nr:type II toxin-antitoxin system MqsA family antitoxin [Desulfococcaceae bacterium HSG8]